MYMNNTRKVPIFLAIIFIGVGLAYLVFNYSNKDSVKSPVVITEPDKQSGLIYLETPAPNQTISSPFTILGQARGQWFFEASFPIKIYDDNSKLLGTTVAQPITTDGNWMTENFVPFKAELEFNNSTSASGFLVLEKDNPSGLPENYAELRVPVNFLANREKIKVKVYFNNNILDQDVSCDKVFPVEREIVKTEAVARAAIMELLAGTTSEEEKNGFSKIIGADVKIQALTIENGVAKVDFSEELEKGGGSCRSAAIIAQISSTLKQFSSVKDVIISINGRTEDILQP